jgi:hypothetical protein
MSQEGPNRRDFLKSAGLSIAGFGMAKPAGRAAPREVPKSSASGEAPLPFSSLLSVFEAPRGQYFGVKTEERFDSFGDGRSGRRVKLVPRDSKTYYLADGLSGEEEPHSFQLTFDITNNSILCAATQSGLLKNPCVFSRMVPARRRGKELRSQELMGGSAWSFGLLPESGSPVRLALTHGAQVQLLGSVFPIFSYQVDDLSVELLVFAPQSPGSSEPPPRAILAALSIHNRGENTWKGSVLAPGLRDAAEADACSISTPAESPHPRFTELPVPVAPGFEAVMCMDQTRWSPRCPEVRAEIRPGDRAVYAFALLLETGLEELRATREAVLQRSALDWFNESWNFCTRRYGRLTIPSEPYFSESLVRLIEADSSAVLYSAEGRLFTGGPSGWVDYAMMLFEPRFMADHLRSLAGYRRRDAGSSAPRDLGYSLVTSLGLLPSAGLYYRATGDRDLFLQAPGILEFARERLNDILDLRKEGPYLFPSERLWDGPTLGDYHTGSNILAWLAFQGMGRIAREVYGENELGDQWETVAVRIKEGIYRHCVGPSRLGPRFYEAGNADGGFAPGHNGEEAFTTLAPFFGFCEADDPALINHAKLAFTEENPLYEPAVDGIWWGERGDRYSGATTPGQMAMLVANNDEEELRQRLDQLRTITDLDGSIWWWPYLYPCNDRLNVRRRDWPVDTSKSGFTMAIAATLLVNNVLGLAVDVPGRRVSLRPFSPWGEFSWTGAKLGHSLFDVAYQKKDRQVTGRITNRNDVPYVATIELLLDKEQELRAAALNGTPAPDAEPTRRFGRAAVRISATIAPGRSAELQLEL